MSVLFSCKALAIQPAELKIKLENLNSLAKNELTDNRINELNDFVNSMPQFKHEILNMLECNPSPNVMIILDSKATF